MELGSHSASPTVFTYLYIKNYIRTHFEDLSTVNVLRTPGGLYATDRSKALFSGVILMLAYFYFLRGVSC